MDWRLMVWLIIVVLALIALWVARSLRKVIPGGGVVGLGRARRNGYAVENVDELLDHVYAQPDTAAGHAEALRLLNSARFHLDRTGGYQPVAVDRLVDELVAALSSEAPLPPRPPAG